MHRRDFLRASGALAACLGLPALAADHSARRFLFVFADGGWDPTRVFAPQFGTQAAMESEAGLATVGNLPFVDHVDRPSVRRFLEQHHGMTTVFNGVEVPSIAHEVCSRLILTGSLDDGRPSWPSILGTTSDAPIPHLVLDGPHFAGSLGASTVRAGGAGQLADLLEPPRTVLGDGRALSESSARTVEAWVRSRSVQRRESIVAERAHQRLDAFERSLSSLPDVRERGQDLGLRTFIDTPLTTAVRALASGTARVVSTAHGTWDTHSANDFNQSRSFEWLFADLLELMDLLATIPGPTGRMLMEDTTVVVLSEMGRTPQLNLDEGKDHWPYTSAMVLGAGFAGDRVIGAYDDDFNGMNLDPWTGAIGGDRRLTTGMLGATLLRSAGIDPERWLPGAPAVESALS